MMTEVLTSTPVGRSQESSPDFGQRINLDAPEPTFKEYLAPKITEEMRGLFKQDWLTVHSDEYRWNLALRWSPPDSIRGSQMIRLFMCPQERGDSLPGIAKRDAHWFCNKATVFYWMRSATIPKGDADGLAILGSIWNIWADALGRQPQFQLDEFFAVPVSFVEKMVMNVPEVLQAHKNLCSQVRGMLEGRGPGADRDPRYFRLNPICEALITFFDEYKYMKDSYRREADGSRHYANVAQYQSILLVRTGKEDSLSAPISFDSLKHKALPLARDEDMGTIDIIRVPLQDGVRFVANLLLREEAALPQSVLGRSYISISKEPDHPIMKGERDALAWGEELLASAVKRGKISSSSTAADVSKKALCHDWLSGNPDIYEPVAFKFGWV